MALINSTIFFVGVPVLVDVTVPADVPVTRKDVVGRSVGANAVARWRALLWKL